MKKITKVLSVLLLIAMIVSMTACSATKVGNEQKQSSETKAENKEPVVVKFPTFYIGSNSGAEWMKNRIETFKEKYGDTIDLQVEEVPGDQAYTDKIKVLLSTDQLPDVVYTGGYNLLDDALVRNAVVDLTPYLEADPEWKALFPEEDLSFNTRDGKVYAIPETSSQIGYFYNKELFEKAGITSPAKTWDELFMQAEALKQAGIVPFAMDTADSGWVTTLWLNSMIGTANEEGNKWMNTMYPVDYNTLEVIEAVGKIQKMFMNYTTKDAVGGKYENAANHFFNGEVAMIANGPWMEADFHDTTKAPEGFASKVGVAMYPNDGMFVSPVIGMFVASKDKEHADAAVEWVKWLTNEESQLVAFETSGRTPVTPTLAIPEDVREKLPLSSQLLEMSAKAKYKYNYHQALWYPNTLDAVSAYYPMLATGKMTPEEFCNALSEEAKKNQ
ncbi:hypothetical protein CDQ84_17875 [Clostridium thermosuccinogenes]|jgi:raffinose/stachyose/melibiose transport system substrate-binding protein|uniref:ABC transporter substrate-binding protein n=1 Tax=Clostridium thermosuccinogenes TaxID=84032 RepID=A0A2K2F885_9CLOT|nr:extracellular solute-binding protein [Pseudoclostridium thermosuccinogenes]AUS96498.1 hypothetical protein CDO33_08670 [Pseudoclostridium thermosuccinogenes]PNT92839.1 hypothetical protein CDQ83_04570 [Pseudoclostridium thermosuccinogenes]PNT94545.1 hypothetical protein CDQ85_17835 [Pseudoclostridium thermosuccinogenes]PNT94992.1 hypothetical protein CDQ84_17875 [Pseudoclostridium thermosuccinogenes]